MADSNLYNTREVLQLLTLETLGGDRFRGQSLDFFGGGRVFGGQALGQALWAACATVPGRRPHSLHAMFVLPGDAGQPIDYEIDRVRDGGSFSTRQVTALQGGRRIFTMSVSFQIDEQGFSHQSPMPEASDPESLPEGLVAWKARLEAAGRPYHPFPVDLRIDGNPDMFSSRSRQAERKVWARTPLALPDDPMVHDVLLACVSDYGLLWTALQPHGVSLGDPRLQIASLDHAVWFHRPFRMDDWLLFAMESPNASGGRGLSLARVYDRSGALVASVAQEGLIRRREAVAPGS